MVILRSIFPKQKNVQCLVSLPISFYCQLSLRSKVGLLIYRSILPPEIQLQLLDKIFHRDLSNPDHLTNVHLHYDVPYPQSNLSYFHVSSSGLTFHPRDPTVHKPFGTQQFLRKKLRWMTLGGQYDWTNKVYPDELPPEFPEDMANLISSLFGMKPEAAIVNLYSPGDTLSLHRDVSEECDRPLVSISLACDGIFLIGLDSDEEGDEGRMVTLRLRSGDVVVMAGESRYAWHGVPKVVEGTCPQWMESWPAGDAGKGEFESWRGWMKGKRINLNVRQMFA